MNRLATNTALGCTHFVVVGHNNARAFSVDTCEKCGCQCEGANGVFFREPRAKLLALGMKQLPEELPELGYCDALGLAVCPDCYVEE